jgi:predicted dehydrogenase
MSTPTGPSASRRSFLKTSSLLVAGGAVAASQLNVARAAHPFGSDTIKIGLIGCGGRGTGAADQAMNTEGQTKLVAMGDVFPNQVQAAFRGLKGKHGDKVDVPRDKMFDGIDAYKGVLDSDIDLVILATPPGFRPQHIEAAIKAGKHVFAEKPVATDAPGVRRVLAAAEEAKKKDLALAIGLQRRHERAYMEIISELQGGKIGDINFTRAYWNSAGVWVRPRKPKQTELEYQINNWYYFNWLSGDHIVEQHIHNLDVINWLKNGYPVKGQGVGGREVRKGPDYGQIFDHHMIEFTYADGSKLLSQCRHIPNCWDAVSEYAHGSQGNADISGGKIYDLKGKMIWQTKGGRDGHQVEHHDLFAELRKGNRPNEGEWGAKSTMTAIFGRMCTYTGQEITWDEAIKSEVVLCNTDAIKDFNSDAPIKPDAAGNYPLPVPGLITKV